MPPLTALVLTSTHTLASLRHALTTAKAGGVKVVVGHGLGRPWDSATIAELVGMAGAVIVRTTWGDPSYRADAEDRAMPYAARVIAELRSWLVARPDAWIELGNEPLVADQRSEEYAHVYAYHLGESVSACRQAFPQARLIAPAHLLNHRLALGPAADGVGRFLEIAAPQYRRCDALGLHAYTVEQAQRGMRQLRQLVSGSLPIWLTEFALNESLPDAERGQRYRAILDDLPVAVACLYHWDELGGADPVHFNPHYRLSLPALAAFAAPPSPVPAPPVVPVAPRLDDLDVTDARAKLPTIRARRPAPRAVPVASVTLHYNGPPVPGFGSPAREWRHVVQVDVPNHQQRLSADSLQYHFVVLSDGAIHQTRDLELPAWHCGDAEGNRSSIAVHLPLGGTQDATPAQWAATERLFFALIAEYRLAGRTAVKGHDEWKPTLCPGPQLRRRLQSWRTAQPSAGGLYRIRGDVAAANVREGPGRAFPIALGGRAVMWPGDMLDADALVAGELVGDDPIWLHRRDGVGFVHRSLVEGGV